MVRYTIILAHKGFISNLFYSGKNRVDVVSTNYVNVQLHGVGYKGAVHFWKIGKNCNVIEKYALIKAATSYKND